MRDPATSPRPWDVVLPPPLPDAGPLSVRRLERRGPPVVLIHGLGRAAAAWWRVAERLEGRLHLLLPDNPGQGGSRTLPVPATVEEHAALHAATLERLGIDEPVHVVGLSLGGMIALALAARLGPGRCASVTAMAASSRESGFWRLDGGALLRIAGRVLARRSVGLEVTAPELLSPERLAAEPDLVATCEAMQEAEGARRGCRLRQLLAATRFRARALRPRLPQRSYAVVGGGDRFVPPGNSERLAKLLDLPLLTLPGAGHDLGFDRPREVAWILGELAAGRPPSLPPG